MFEALSLLAIITVAYAFGSITSAVLVCRALGAPDPRQVGSNNPGATNVLRVGGKGAAGLVLGFDFAKGWLPVLAAEALFANPYAPVLAGLGAFLGHLYPVFFRFRGGKGVATAAGVFAGFSPTLGVVLVLVWLLGVALFRRSSLAAVCAAVATPPLVAWWQFNHAHFGAHFFMALVVVVLLLWRHRENFRRLRSGEEPKITRTGHSR